MLESLPEAQQAAIGFLDYSIGPKDRGFTISFDNEPYVLSKLTNRKDKLYRSLAGLRAEGSTALYDAIVYGLYQFTGVKGKKALVILSDGKDTASKFDYDTLLEYVKKSGIAVYAIGLKIPTAELDVKYKLNKLAQVTGGQTFYDRFGQEPRGRLPADQRGAAEPVPADLLLDEPGGQGQVAQGRGEGRADEPGGQDALGLLPVIRRCGLLGILEAALDYG